MPVTRAGVIEDVAEINRSIDEAFDFTADFSRIQEWDPGVKSSQRIGEGPVGVGAKFALVTVFKGQESKMEYTITEYERPNRVVLVGESDGVRAVDTIRFTSTAPTKTRVNYTADLTLKGLRRPFIVFVGAALNELGRAAMTGLEKRLNSQ